eukprot:gnl/Ergobibamus_cyprinoides/548.p2 GENE.gnl/Ergobibamus_cyprinoides/548~~gnl/Ergobibamus_cyprinoides/548.p2  ORF type:complete len:452 (+),score=245.83 gnl/Ergobibamus_cyprinoides/548:519-1874(+)
MAPSLTLGCGSWGLNSVSANVGPMHLLNIKTVTQKRENPLWFKNPPKIYFKSGCLELALRELGNKTRAFIVTDKVLFDLGYCARVTDILDDMKIKYATFTEVEPDPTFATVKRALTQVESFKPDVFIALGGGSAMDAAKIVRLMYEHPAESFEGMCVRFMDIRKRIYTFPELQENNKSTIVCIPTTSGTGSEVTPFAVVTDERTAVKYPIADYALTPQMAIIDASFVLSMPRFLCAWTGMDVLTHAIESYVSVMATDFTIPMSMQAIKLVFQNMKASFDGDKDARENMHHAACIAGIAFSNAFLGLVHSMSHKLGQAYHIPHGLANAIMLPYVIRYNATDAPKKMGCFPQYKYPQAIARYAEIARAIGLTAETDAELVDKLIAAIDELNASIGIPKYISGTRNPPTREKFVEHNHALATFAFDDQCTGANPRYPLISEIEELYIEAYGPEM